ncbi:MAG: hypothetical protein ACRD3N_10260 [Terracidiphilus sp.]
MANETILAQVDSEIARLTQVRSLLANAANIDLTVRNGKVKKTPAKARTAKKRVLSAEARKRIAEAQRKRWAAQKARARKEA